MIFSLLIWYSYKCLWVTDLHITISMVTKTISYINFQFTIIIIRLLLSLQKYYFFSIATCICEITLRRRRDPQMFFKAIITLIYKKGPWNTALNYGPVSLISVICRTEKHIFLKHMTSYLMKHCLIFDV